MMGQTSLRNLGGRKSVMMDAYEKWYLKVLAWK